MSRSKQFLRCCILALFALVSVRAFADNISSNCVWDSKHAKPDWVSNPNYSLLGYEVAVGLGHTTSKGKDEQKKTAEEDAAQKLVQQISVTVKSSTSKSTDVDEKGKVHSSESVNFEAVSRQILNGLKVQDFWVDRETCTYYTLVMIRSSSLKLGQFKKLLAEGTDNKQLPDLNDRLNKLEIARALFQEIDFSTLPNELDAKIYKKRLDEALAQIHVEQTKAGSHIALFAINEDHTLSTKVLAQLAEKFPAGEAPYSRPSENCGSKQDCINIAKQHGYPKLILLNATTSISATPMGMIKGLLSVSRTVVDIDNGNAEKGSNTVTMQVLGLSRDDLDWGMAADKVIQGFQ